MPAVSGFAGRVVANGTKLTATRWQVMWKADALDVTCFEAVGGPSNAASALTAFPGPGAGSGAQSNQGTLGAGGFGTPVSNWTPGITDAECSVDAYWDNTIDPFGLSPFLVPGLQVLVALFYSRNVVGAAFDAVILLESVSMDVEVRGVVKYSFTGKVAGTDGGISFPPNA